jgi:outer membrane protein
MRLLIVRATILFGVVFSTSCFATDLMEVYDLGLRNDPKILAASYEYESAAELIPQAKAQLKPFVYAEWGHRETKQNISSSDNEVFAVGETDYPTQTYGITLKQPIYRHASWANLRQAKAEVKKALAERSIADQDLLLRVSELYLGVLAAQDDLALSQTELEAVRQQLKLTQTRRASGLAIRSDVYDAEARFSTVEAKEIEARNRLDNAHQALMQSTGELRTDLSPLREEIPLVKPSPMRIEEWVQSALDSNFSLAALRHAAEIAEHEAEKQKGARYPSLEFVARWDNRDTDGSLFGGGSEVETADYSVQLNVPLYQGGGPSSKIRQAYAQLNRARQNLRFEQSQVTRDTRTAYLGTISAIEKVKALANSVKAQESAVQAKEKGYRSGLNTTLDVLDAQAILFFIRRDYAQARYDYLLNTLRLKRSTGRLSREDLQQVSNMLQAVR